MVAEMGRKKLYVHVGLHKTGTSAIQRFLRANEKALEVNGFYYPPDQSHGDAQHTFAAALKTTHKDNAHLQVAERWLSKCGAYCTAHSLTLLISTEMLSEAIRHRELNRLAADFDVTVIIYLRRQDLLIESVCNQVLKQDLKTYPEEELLNLYGTDFCVTLNRWKEIFPAARLIVRRYGQLPDNRTIEMDFLDALGINSDKGFLFENRTVNESLKLYEYLILRNLVRSLTIKNAQDLEAARIEISAALKERSISDVSMVGNYFSRQIREKILDQCAATNETVRKNYFPESNVLFTLPSADYEARPVDSALIADLQHQLTVRA